MALEKANHPIRWWKRIGTLGKWGGWHGAKYMETLLLDHILYGAVNAYTVIRFGVEMGAYITFLIMAPLSAGLCLIYIRLYNRAKLDLFGFESIKAVRDEVATGGWWTRLLRCVIRLGDFPAFVVLNCFWPNGDPFMATVYLRRKVDAFSGLTRRDWDIFWASVVVANGYWTVRWTVIVWATTEFLWPVIRSTLQWLSLL